MLETSNSQIDSSQFEELYAKLNEQQKAAVDAVDGPVMVIAGAGTGKTQILAMRIANILQHEDLQMNPQNILCLTFTESAVTAMRKRLTEIIGSAAYYVKIHTFHSFCNEVIKEHPEKFLVSSKFSRAEELDLGTKEKAPDFISELEQIEVFNEIIDSLPGTSPVKPYGDPYFYRSDLTSNIKTLKREAISPENLLEVLANLEAFLNHGKDHIEDFISRHARTIKEEDCNYFIEKLNILCPKDEFKHYLSLIEQYQNQSEKISEFKKKVKDFYEKNLKAIPKQKDLAKVYSKYNEILAKRKLYDFEDMILWVTDKFGKDKELLAEYQEMFQYILVDEYQDTNGAQNEILELITEFHGDKANIFVVGDDDQSIYRFQGASVENIVYFYQRYKKEAKFIVLEDNYRSNQTILDASHSVISQNTSRISNVIPDINKKLTAKADIKPAQIELHEVASNKDETLYLAKKIQELIESGIEPRNIAVLYRTNRDVLDLIDIFSRLEVPFKVEAGNNILKNLDILQLIDLLTIVENPHNDNLLFNVLNYEFLVDENKKAFSPREIFEITRLRSEINKEASQNEDKSSVKHLIDLLIENTSFKHFAENIYKWKQKSKNLNLDTLFEMIFKESNYLSFAMSQPNRIELLNRLNTLFDEIKILSRSNKSIDGKFTLKDFLKHIELLKENNLQIKEHPLKTNSNAVNLMTAHRSKGLEFDHVFIVKCNDKHWGNRKEMSRLKLPAGLIKESESFANTDNNEDERRLFYVALTRAKKQAHITYSKTNEKGKSLVPSIFTQEIANALVNKNSPDASAGQSELEQFETIFKDKVIKDSIEDQKDFVDKILENYKLSVTHLNNYLQCPRMFFYKNLIRVPSAKNKHASFGTAIHAALYDLFMKYRAEDMADNPYIEIQETELSELDYLISRFEYHLSQERLPEGEASDSLDFGKEVLKNYYENYKEEFIKDSLLEYDFSRLGVSHNDMVLTGKLDKIEILSKENKTVNVVDYKTGNPSNKSSELKAGGDYHRQVAFYKYLCDLANASGQFPYQMISGEVDFIQTTSDDKFVKKKIAITEADLEKLKEEINFMQEGIKAQNFDKTDDTKICEKCSFYSLCFS